MKQTKDTLKTFFERGDKPTQEQFSDLIDSFRDKDLTNDEVITISNRMNSINAPYIEYNIYPSSALRKMENLNFKLKISDSNGSSQIIELKRTLYANPHPLVIPVSIKKQYFTGNGPHTISACDDLATPDLETNVYYVLTYWSNERQNAVIRLLGNDLPTISEGFEFGVLEEENFHLTIEEKYIPQEVTTVNTNIAFINDTGIAIKYKPSASYWSSGFTDTDSITEHYSAYDALNIYYRADLTNETSSIDCKIYDMDANEELLSTINLAAGQNHINMFGFNIDNRRNIKIECNYVNA